MKPLATINGITWLVFDDLEELGQEVEPPPVSGFMVKRQQQLLIRKEIEKAL